MAQIGRAIEQLKLQSKLVISIADLLYSTQSCREKVGTHPNWVHISRLNSKRNVYALTNDKNHGTRYGKKMQLNRSESHIDTQERVSFSRTMSSGRQLQVTIRGWTNLVLRGSKKFKGYNHPVTLYQICVTDDQGKAKYKRPLWLVITGERREEISAEEAYDYYISRYDIEHYFRFSKEKLLIDSYQTPSVEHEQNWWKLCALAYTQLYLARKTVPLLPRKWERYLPNYKSQTTEKPLIATATQTQRGFYHVLSAIGTPAKACRARGNPTGRTKGEEQTKRERHPIIFKNTKQKKLKNMTISVSEKLPQNSDSQTIEVLAKNVAAQLEKMNISTGKFTSMLQNSS